MHDCQCCQRDLTQRKVLCEGMCDLDGKLYLCSEQHQGLDFLSCDLFDSVTVFRTSCLHAKHQGSLARLAKGVAAIHACIIHPESQVQACNDVTQHRKMLVDKPRCSLYYYMYLYQKPMFSLFLGMRQNRVPCMLQNAVTFARVPSMSFVSLQLSMASLTSSHSAAAASYISL